MSTNNICFYKEVVKKYTGSNPKKSLDCTLIGVHVCAVIRSNTLVILSLPEENCHTPLLASVVDIEIWRTFMRPSRSLVVKTVLCLGSLHSPTYTLYSSAPFFHFQRTQNDLFNMKYPSGYMGLIQRHINVDASTLM